MKNIFKILDWLYYLSLEFFHSAHVDRGKGIDHFYDDKRAHILVGSIIAPILWTGICLLTHYLSPTFNWGNNELYFCIVTILIVVFVELFFLKRYNKALSLDHHMEIFSQWNLAKQILMMLLPLGICILTYSVFFVTYHWILGH